MIFGAFERLVAFRYLRARRQEGFISVIAGFSLLGIALGVATLIIVMSVMNGFRAELLGRILGVNGHLGVYGMHGPLADYDGLAGKIRGVDGVVAVNPLIQGQVLVTGPRGSNGAMVRGKTIADLKGQAALAQHITRGSLDALGDDSVMIGSRLAFNLGVGIGDNITILSPQGTATAFGTVPRVKTYKVGAIFDVGEYTYDSSFIYMPLASAQLLFKLPGFVTSLEVFVANPDHVLAQQQAIGPLVGDKAVIFDWQHENQAIFNAVQTEKHVMFLILTLIIVVAAFNIISSMIMLVKDKGHDIAILRTMGATRGMIMRIFFLSGASVGVVGTLLGTGLGLGFAWNIESIREFLQQFTGSDLFSAEIYFLSQLPAKVDPTEVVMVVSMAFALSFLATIYPSWRAARLDPVEALRYE